LKADPKTVARVREKTGLVIDAYFSGTKIAWLLDTTTARAPARRPASSRAAPSTPSS
jgi:glycerol kinase